MNTGLLMAFIFYIANFLFVGGMCSYAVAKKIGYSWKRTATPLLQSMLLHTQKK